MAESLRARFRRAANRLLHPCGLHLARCEAAFEMDDMLAHAVERGVAIKTWVDVGASDGQWSVRARRYFPSSRYLLFEPLAERQAALAIWRDQLGFIPVPAAAGSAPGTIEFIVDAALDGSAVATPGTKHTTRLVPVETIDRMLVSHNLTGPYGLKLDTHGHEIAVLEGAVAALRNTDFLIIEAYNFQLTPTSLRFHELCAWMENHSFRCCDIADPMRRPRDDVFWQVDLGFIRNSSPFFKASTYN